MACGGAGAVVGDGKVVMAMELSGGGGWSGVGREAVVGREIGLSCWEWTRAKRRRKRERDGGGIRMIS